jgi:hypothetical protein
MSRQPHVEEPEHHGAPKWYVGFSTLTTILMTFFITMTVSMGEDRDLGYVGPGSGAFRDAFNSHGMSGVLRSARRVVDFVTWGDKYLPENAASSESGQINSARLLEMPARDLKQCPARTESASRDVLLPLPLRYGESVDKEGRDRLAAAARILRQSDSSVLVCANLPTGGDSVEETLIRSAGWAAMVARHLSAREAVPSARLTAVGRASTPDSTDAVKEPTLTLVIRPADRGEVARSEVPAALRRRPTEQQQVIQ